MNLLKNFSVKLTQEELTQLIHETVERQTGRKVKNVWFNIADSYDDRYSFAPARIREVTVDLGEEVEDVNRNATTTRYPDSFPSMDR